jgi:hypothetical protein
MPLSDIVEVNISIAELAPSLPGQGLALLLGDVTEDQALEFGDDLTVEVAPATWQTQLDGLGFTGADPMWVALSDFFAQSLKPSAALIGRRDTAVAQVVDVQVVANGAGDYSITVQGEIAEVTIAAETITQIRDLLLAEVNLLELAAPVEVTATAVSTDIVRLTSDNAGVPFTYDIASPGDNKIELDAETAGYGIADDVTAILGERGDWYALFGDWRTTPEILIAAEVIEPMERIYLAQSADGLANTPGSDSDVGSLLLALNYMRSSVMYSSNSAQWVEGALLGRMLPERPGSKSFANKTLASVTGDVFTSTTGLTNKNYGWLESLTAFVPPRSVTRQGKAASGTFLDLVVLRDYLAQQLRILAYELATSDLPYTDIGGSTIKARVKQTLIDVADYTQAIDKSTILVSTLTKAQQTSENRAARRWGGTTWSLVATGRVHELQFTGTIQP